GAGTGSGACTSGSTARRWDATRRGSGSGGETNTDAARGLIAQHSQEIPASRAKGTDMDADTGVRDATRRTRLANERTYLAWWRSGLTALAVSFAAGRLLPELSHGPNWPFEVVGIAFAVVGIVFMTYGYVRHREVEAALDRGDYERLPDRAAFALAAIGGLLGVATVLLVVLHTT